MAQAVTHENGKLVRTLASVALALWVASLFLVSFLTFQSEDTYYGLLTLGFGTFFGWMVVGFAVYANPFFLYAVVKLRGGASPSRAVLTMVVLTLSLPFFKGVVRDEGSGTIMPVVSWGWGAVSWVLAIYLVTIAACLREGLLGRLGTYAAMFLPLGALIGLGATHVLQSNQANLQERALQISPAMAFTVKPLCGIQVAWPESPVVPEGAYVRVEHDPALLKVSENGIYAGVPPLIRYEQNGIDFTRHTSAKEPHFSVSVRSPASPKRYVLKSQATAQGALIQILDEQQVDRVLYEQPIKVWRGAHGKEACPSLVGPFGVTNAIVRALGQEQPAQFLSAELVDSVAREKCDLGFVFAEEPGKKQAVRLWDGKEVELMPESIRSRAGFCSERYVGLVYVSKNPDVSRGLGRNLNLFDRRTLQPIAAYNDNTVCPRNAHCADVTREFATGFRVEGGQAIIETTEGDLVAQRRLR